MARVKKVYPTDEIAHLWAHQTQSEARNPGGNFYFQDKTIYSYGSHFPIARHVTNDKGEAAILFTNRTYSNTTAKHIGNVRQSLPPGVPVFYVHNPKDQTASEYRTQRADVEALIKKLQAARPDNRYEYKVKTSKIKFNIEAKQSYKREVAAMIEIDAIAGRNVVAHEGDPDWNEQWRIVVRAGVNAGTTIQSGLSKTEARIMLDILDSIKTWDVSTADKKARLGKKVAKARDIAKEFGSISRNPGTLTKLYTKLQSDVRDVNALGAFFGYGPSLSIPADLDYLEAVAIAHEHRIAAARETASATRRSRWDRAEAARAERDEKAKVTFAENLPRWLAGANVSIPYSNVYGGTSYLRIDGNEVQTSQGARVPLEHVKKALPVVLAYVQNGREYHRNGHTIHLGHYSIDSIDANGNLRAGCHLFNKAEIERFAGVLEALPAEPEVSAPIPPTVTPEGNGATL
jgi:hypothetical protein